MSEIERLTLRGTNVDLAADAIGPADGQPVLFLHGSGQTRQSWGKALLEAARHGYRAISMDLRGHGDSGWSPDGQYSLTVFADDLRTVLAALDQPPVIVGASLGGLVAMIVAAADPSAIRALVLVDITAHVDMDGAQEVIAFMSAGADGFASVEDAADAVAAYLPHRERPASSKGLARNLRLRDGRYYWHWDPAFMSMGADPKQQAEGPSVLEMAARDLTIPTLLIRGGRSRIVTEEGARAFMELVPHADYVHIDGAHHMVAGDANDAFNDAVIAFVDRQAG
ncbi:alpha/beta hydrolase [Sphingobium sp. BYY-5]|uniref:alpha/beta fold hydrolase n=1 Tax=Sphingobium sp. BYY-5 TaxID=2926400 RepID=UPI001FA6C990|nr:alpha/beta hydrolase [Sphingobium sp. BYY-5]MCI4592371.1 alpha/beta hydrolase [Sphingobium sp. BYY-5]